MSRYHPSTHYPIAAGDVNGGHEHREERGRYDRESPMSAPDPASNYTQYLQHARDESDPPEDPHLALTSQTLNADGTPKRPMNAFMIFARKRRPQISAANQMMRTGDISKILSKEWNSMEMSEKKFYLDQAKKLKDTFNSKYPDYVYRRRPNNSRKKRKIDSEHSPQGLSSSAEVEDLDDASPVDSDDAMLHPTGEVYTYPQAHTASAYETHGHFASATPGYAHQPPDFSSGQYNQPPNRMSHLQSPAAPIRLSSLADTNPTYPSHTSQYNQPSLYNSQDARAVHNAWESSRETGKQDQGRAGWPILPALDTNMARPRTSNLYALQNEKSEPYSPQLSHRSWSGSTPSSSSGASTNYSNPSFPTLTSAFYPGQSPSQRTMEPTASPNSASHLSHVQDYHPSPSTHMHPRLPFAGRQSEQSSFTQSTTLPLPTVNAYMTQTQSVNGWQSSQYRNGTMGSAQRLSPPSLPGVTLPPPTSTLDGISSAGPVPHAQMTYWERR
ncbi:hypothetical protein B0H21DRAFT_338401 [Amylocystis lapponica]|nr:hypothetical protein B0H21DRAFT_338401 [Amylocystis lapponica]